MHYKQTNVIALVQNKRKNTCSVISEYNVCTVKVNCLIIVLHCSLKVFYLVCCIAKIFFCYGLYTHAHHHDKHLRCVLDDKGKCQFLSAEII